MVGFCFRYHEEFLLAIMGEREITCTVDEALKSLRAAESIYTIPEKYRK